MASFVDKLRLDNLYPSLPTRPRRRTELMQPIERMPNRLEQIAEQAMQPLGPPNQVTKPMDVVFNEGNISETGRAMNAARIIHNTDLNRNALSPYQAGQLSNRGRELDIRDRNVDLGQQRIDETAEMGEWKRNNPGGKIVYQPDGKIIAIGPDNKIAGEFGPSGKMAEERKLGVEQQNAIQRLDRGGEIRGALEDKAQYGRSSLQGQRDLASMARTQVTAGNKPIGTNRDVSYQYDDKGTVIGAKSRTEQILPEKKPGQGTTVTMYGPNGEGPYPVPTERTDEMQDKYGMTFSPTKKVNNGSTKKY